MGKLKVLELFSGIGACSKALERLGIDYELVDSVEIDKYAVKSFNAVHGTNFEPQDICKWDKDLEVDLIMHGSPCQDFSLAGKQAGGDEGSGTRSSLMYETIRIVEKLKPKYVIWENVKNLLSQKHRHNFDAYLQTMEQLGYKNYYQVLNAKDYGIPQNRERVFTISILGEDTFEFPEKQELKLKLKDMLEDKVDDKFYLSDDKIEMISKWNCFEKPFSKVYGNESVLTTLTTRSGAECGGLKLYSDGLKDTTDLQEQSLHIKENNGLYDLDEEVMYIKNNTKQGYLTATDGDCVNICGRMQYQRGNVQKGISQTLTTHGGEERAVVLKEEVPKSMYTETEKKLFTEDGNIRRYINSDIIDKFQEGQMATTSYPNGYGHGPRTHNESISLNLADKPSVKHHLRIRKLTPKECWRLMGFNDTDYERASEVCSQSQLYKQAGNIK